MKELRPPGPETRSLYESMTTDRLRQLRAAFLLDASQAISSFESSEFIRGRLALIAEVLAGRKD